MIANQARIASTTAVLAAIVLSACSSPEATPEAERMTVTDSAGIQIVTSRVDGLPVRSVGVDPVFSIGSLEGGDQALFNVQSVDRFPSGEWLIANAGTGELRVFSGEGQFQRAFGGEGEGPGEFQNLSRAAVFGGDSVFAYDFRARRVSIFSRDGELARTASPAEPEGAGRAAPIAVMANGNLPSAGASSFTSEMESNTIVRPRTTGVLYDSEGGFIRTMDEYGGSEQFFLQGADFISIRSVPFAKTSRLAASDTRIFSGATEHPEIRVRDDQGDLVAIWRLGFEPRPVTPDDWATARDRELDAADPEAHETIQSFYETAPPPERYPAWGQILVSEEGHLWLQQYSPPTGDPTNRWWRFDDTGALAEEIELPAGFDPEWVSGDLVVGTWEDDFEVEYVRGYRLGG